MTEDTDIQQVDEIEDQLDQTLNTLRSHLNEIASVVAKIRGEEYGKFTLNINGALWTLKHENGKAQWFRRTVDGDDTYILSTRSETSPSDVANAMDDYPQFIEEVNNWIEGLSESLSHTQEEVNELDGLVDGIEAESILDKRESLEQQAWNVTSHVGYAVHQVTGNDYGSFKTTIDGEEWVLKYQDGGSAKYLKIGGTYVLGRDSAHPKDLAKLIQNFDHLINSVNSWLEQQNENLQFEIEITEVEMKEANDDNE